MARAPVEVADPQVLEAQLTMQRGDLRRCCADVGPAELFLQFEDLSPAEVRVVAGLDPVGDGEELRTFGTCARRPARSRGHTGNNRDG